MTERSGNTPPPTSTPTVDDATVVIAHAAQPGGQAVPAETPPGSDPSPQRAAPATANAVASRHGTSSSFTAQATQPTLAGAQPVQPSGSPLWAIVLGALSGGLLFALTAALLIYR